MERFLFFIAEPSVKSVFCSYWDITNMKDVIAFSMCFFMCAKSSFDGVYASEN